MTSAASICSLGAALRLRPLSRDPHRHSGHAACRSVLMKRLTADGSSSAAIQPKKPEKKRRVHLNNGPGRPSQPFHFNLSSRCRTRERREVKTRHLNDYYRRKREETSAFSLFTDSLKKHVGGGGTTEACGCQKERETPPNQLIQV